VQGTLAGDPQWAKICYAQWEDVGPFYTDSAVYVFGDGQPSPNVNHGAGIDVSPAVRDYLGLGPLGLVNSRFVEQAEVPAGPWSVSGNTRSKDLRDADLGRRKLWSGEYHEGRTCPRKTREVEIKVGYRTSVRINFAGGSPETKIEPETVPRRLSVPRPSPTPAPTGGSLSH